MNFQEIIPGVFEADEGGQKRLASYSQDPQPVYGERIRDGYRFWDPFRSKLAALLLKAQGPKPAISRDAKVLYLWRLLEPQSAMSAT